MIKGHVCIELHNHNSGFKERIEQDNLITKALQYSLGHVINGNSNPSASNFLTPVATKALGGLLMFDGELEESEDNVNFPMNVHLKGHAGQSLNTSDVLRGSLNTSESGRSDTGYTNVWDFSTSQANGNIASLALTSHKCGDSILDQVTNCDFTLYNSSRNYDQIPIDYDKNTKTLYLYSVSNRNYRIHSVRFPDWVITAHDPYVAHFTTLLTDLIDSVQDTSDGGEYYYGDNFILTNGDDGYLYAICIGKQSTRGAYVDRKYEYYNEYGVDNETGDSFIRIRKYKMAAGDYSFEQEGEEVTAVLSNVHARADTLCVSGGYVYVRSYDNVSVYKINLNRLSDISNYKFPTGTGSNWYVAASEKIFPMKGGGIWTGQGIIMYPDGTFLRENIVTSGDIYYNPSIYLYLKNRFPITPELMTIGYNSNHAFIQKAKVNQYLGSICNLGSVITKTGSQSMKVIYTLTNV